MIDKRLVYMFVAVVAIVIVRLLLEEDFLNLVILLTAIVPFVQDLKKQVDE